MPGLTITLLVAVVPIAWPSAIGATLSLLVGLVVLFSGGRSVWQTTLASAWCWTLAALVAWSLIELVAAVAPGQATGNSFSAIRLAAMSLSLCPIVALLGAKRPQQQAWNFVVLSLWIILLLPAAETLMLRPGQRLSFGVLRSWLLWVPAALLLMNYLATRYWLAALLAAGGQVLAFGQFLPLAPQAFPARATLLGLLLLTAALVAAHVASLRTQGANSDLDRLWLDFRDTFGAFWALRVQERMNATAQQHGWKATLAWHGFDEAAESASPAAVTTHDRLSPASTFRGLLRRFVSSDWIAARRGHEPRQPAAD